MGISLDRVMAVGGWSNTNRGEKLECHSKDIISNSGFHYLL